jgi:homoserine dehydrogenase
VQQAVRNGCRLKLVAIVRSQPAGSSPGSMPLEVRVEPLALPLTDPLSRIDGVLNGLTIETDTVREITIIGPGAGREQAGQGVFADLVSVLRAA